MKKRMIALLMMGVMVIGGGVKLNWEKMENLVLS